MATARPARPALGPFLLPARVVLAIGGALAIGLSAFNLFHEFHAAVVDRTYLVAAIAIGLLWIIATIFAVAGWRFALLASALLAFIDFGVIASSHFVSTGSTIGSFAKQEGLPVAAVDMAVIPACMLVVISAGVCWTNPRGRLRSWATAPILVVAALGALLVILQATDDIHRVDFGTSTAEDGAFAAAVLASLWLAGGLWIGRARRTGALLIAVATFGVWYSFATLHLVKGGKSVEQIARASGAIWAWIAAGAAVLAAASFLLALGFLVEPLIRRAEDTRAKQPGTHRSARNSQSG